MPSTAAPALSEPFYAWFRQSRIAFEDGSPITVYHGTESRFSVFMLSERGLFGGGIYLTSSREDAEQYTADDAGLMELYVRVERPYYAVADYDAGEEYDLDSPAVGFILELFGNDAEDVIARMDDQCRLGGEIREKLAALGHDGIVVRWPHDGSFHVVVFDPTQIKAATNSGTFCPDDADIYR